MDSPLHMLKEKAVSMLNRKKRSLDKMKNMGLENYLKSKIAAYADSPALVAHFKEELHNLQLNH